MDWMMGPLLLHTPVASVDTTGNPLRQLLRACLDRPLTAICREQKITFLLE